MCDPGSAPLEKVLAMSVVTNKQLTRSLPCLRTGILLSCSAFSRENLILNSYLKYERKK
jgi:hypothetical protein